MPADIVVSRDFEDVGVTTQLEDELNYSPHSVEFVADQVQVVRDGDQVRIHGDGELLTTLVPAAGPGDGRARRGMIHAATVGYRGYAIALPAGGGTGKTSSIAKLMRREGYSFMGDDWAFLGDDRRLLGYAKPMFIRPHHRTIYPHLFQGVRKPMVPTALSRPVGRMTTVVHPHIIKYPQLADLARRWSPEHRIVDAARALPGVPRDHAGTAAGLGLRRAALRPGGRADRGLAGLDGRTGCMGNFHLEMPGFSQSLVTAMAATSMTPWRDLSPPRATCSPRVSTGCRATCCRFRAGSPPTRPPTRSSRSWTSSSPSLLDAEASAAS